MALSPMISKAPDSVEQIGLAVEMMMWNLHASEGSQQTSGTKRGSSVVCLGCQDVTSGPHVPVTRILHCIRTFFVVLCSLLYQNHKPKVSILPTWRTWLIDQYLNAILLLDASTCLFVCLFRRSLAILWPGCYRYDHDDLLLHLHI